MKSQFHYDYPRVALFLFIAFIGYSAGTIVGAVMAFTFAAWIALIIACGARRLLKAIFGKKPNVY